MGARLLLLRHGQIDANKYGRWHGSTDSDLNWRGRRQAKRTGKFLARNESIHAVYASPLRRCQDTAEFASKHSGLPIIAAPGLAEMSIGAWEDMPFQQLAEQHDFVNRASEDPHFAPPQGESLVDVSIRVTAALQEIDKSHASGETVLVVSHGVALAVAVAQLVDGAPSRWTDYHFDNCSLTELYLSPAPYIESFNGCAHL